MTIRSWAVAGLAIGALVSVVLVVSGAVRESNLAGLAIMLGTMMLITVVRRLTLSHVL
jgi:hypothetical protein